MKNYAYITYLSMTKSIFWGTTKIKFCKHYTLEGFYKINAVWTQGGDDEDGGGGGSDIGALLGNLGPLIGGLSGVSML
jgi:hypothetical protein